MLEQIIEQSSSSKDKNEFPTNLPSSHTKYKTHQTTFGRVRVDLPAKSEQRQMIESLYQNYDPTSEHNRTLDTRIWSLVDDDTNNNRQDIDFYGLINAHYRNFSFEEKLSSTKEEEKLSSSKEEKKELEDNYIDQIAFPELTTKKIGITSESIQQDTIKELKNENMNPIDEQYFGTLKQIEYQGEQVDKTIPIKKIEMPPVDDLNYIDQIVFGPSVTTDKPPKTKSNLVPNKTEKILINDNRISPSIKKPINISSPQTSSDNLLDINFQYRISERTLKRTTKSIPDLNESPMSSYNPQLESMRSIKSKDYFDPPRHTSLDVKKEMDTAEHASQPAEHIREEITKKATDRDSFGYRTFDNLIPTWWTMTKAEIVDILVKQICFSRHGILALDKPYGLPTIDKWARGSNISHCIPQIIERLNRPDIRQLHLLHRLDKQSTGVLLMAYTPEAEKRLRDLMQERKVIKQYLTIVRGIPQAAEGEIKIPILERNVRGTYKMMLSPAYNDLTRLVMPKGKRENINSSAAITKYRVIDSNYGVSLVECQPITGVKHQIRTHLAHALGTPILGDHKYSHYAKLAPQKLQFVTLKQLGVRQAKVRTVPLCLHSYSVAIPGFLDHQQNIFIRARLSHHLRYFIQCLRLRMIK